MQTPPRLEAAADLRLVGGLDTFLGRKDAVLLAQVRLTHSLQCAASIAGVGYRQALDHVRTINNWAGRSLVESHQGGAGGGSTLLTPLGSKILDIYTQASRDHQAWLQELNQRLKPELAWTLRESPE
jgi:molybdate transport repressor ModE-like protein